MESNSVCGRVEPTVIDVFNVYSVIWRWYFRPCATMLVNQMPVENNEQM